MRELYQPRDPTRLRRKIDDRFITNLVQKVTEGFAGDVGVVPRQFLRQFIEHMDRVDEYPNYDPSKEAGFESSEFKDLTTTEREILTGQSEVVDDDDSDDLIPAEDVW